MENELAYQLSSQKSFEEVTSGLESKSVENQFRVLAVHDVQATLAEKGFEIGRLKIIEVCNSGFAYEALGKDVGVAMFMPCRYTVHVDKEQTIVTLARPIMISRMLPQAGLEELAAEVETRLRKIMEAVV